ncbi:MAG TPA: hypothetical protein GX700_06305 [Paracoccus sp.]|nr:hypothetical protein [Paracoccus sp. (in: a-proteobacteria)]
MTPQEARDFSPLAAHHLPGPHRIIALGQEETTPFHTQARGFRRSSRRGDISLRGGLCVNGNRIHRGRQFISQLQNAHIEQRLAAVDPGFARIADCDIAQIGRPDPRA